MRNITFIDDSTLRLNAAIHAVFARENPDIVRTLIQAAVEYFWIRESEPAGEGLEIGWSRAYETRGELGAAILNRFHANVEPAPDRGEHTRDAVAEYGRRGIILRSTQVIRRGDPAEIFDLLKWAVEMDVSDPNAWCWYAIAQGRLGNLEDAREASIRAARLREPSHIGDVACPACTWVPDGSPLWYCDSCGDPFDMFATHASCPTCRRQSEVTACPACRKNLPHQTWWWRRSG